MRQKAKFDEINTEANKIAAIQNTFAKQQITEETIAPVYF